MDIIGIWFGVSFVTLTIMCIYWFMIGVFVKIKWIKIIIVGLMIVGSVLTALYSNNLIH